MIGGQVSCRMGVALIARAHVAVLPDVPGDHSLGQAGPSRVRVDTVVGTDAREPRVLAAAATRSAGHDTTDRAELHAPTSRTVARGAAPCRPGGCGQGSDRRPPPAPRDDRGRTWPETDEEPRVWQVCVTARSVSHVDAAVYSPVVLRLRGQSWERWGAHRPDARNLSRPAMNSSNFVPQSTSSGRMPRWTASRWTCLGRTRRASGLLARCQLSPRGSSGPRQRRPTGVHLSHQREAMTRGPCPGRPRPRRATGETDPLHRIVVPGWRGRLGSDETIVPS